MSATHQRVTRRVFLTKSVMAAAAPLAMPWLRFGACGVAAPSDRITVGFIGTGKMAGDYHLPELTGFGDVEALAVCDVDTTRREHARRFVEARYEKAGRSCSCASYDDYRAILARPDIDAVVIATPDHWHALPILDACIAGKDIYCEKPLTLTIREAQLVVEAVTKHGRVFQTGSQQRSGVFGQFPLACELVRSGRIGKVRRVRVGVGGPSRWCDLPEEEIEAGLDWDMWLGQAPMRPYHSTLSPRGVHDHFPNWRAFREYSGGGMTDMGAHHFDIAQWALDMDRSGPVDVIPPDDPQASEGARLVCADGVELIHGGASGCTFEGADGTLYIDRGTLRAEPARSASEPLGPKEVHLPRSPGHHRDWIDCISNRRPPIADVEAGARTVTLCHLMNLAYWHRRRLQWDPQRWRFVNDDEANAWLDRPRRAPWRLPAI